MEEREDIFKDYLEGYINVSNDIKSIDVEDRKEKIQEKERRIKELEADKFIRGEEIQEDESLSSSEKTKKFEEYSKPIENEISDTMEEIEQLKKEQEQVKENKKQAKELSKYLKSIKDNAKNEKAKRIEKLDTQKAKLAEKLNSKIEKIKAKAEEETKQFREELAEIEKQEQEDPKRARDEKYKDFLKKKISKSDKEVKSKINNAKAKNKEKLSELEADKKDITVQYREFLKNVGRVDRGEFEEEKGVEQDYSGVTSLEELDKMIEESENKEKTEQEVETPKEENVQEEASIDKRDEEDIEIEIEDVDPEYSLEEDINNYVKVEDIIPPTVENMEEIAEEPKIIEEDGISKIEVKPGENIMTADRFELDYIEAGKHKEELIEAYKIDKILFEAGNLRAKKNIDFALMFALEGCKNGEELVKNYLDLIVDKGNEQARENLLKNVQIKYNFDKNNGLFSNLKAKRLARYAHNTLGIAELEGIPEKSLFDRIKDKFSNMWKGLSAPEEPGQLGEGTGVTEGVKEENKSQRLQEREDIVIDNKDGHIEREALRPEEQELLDGFEDIRRKIDEQANEVQEELKQDVEKIRKKQEMAKAYNPIMSKIEEQQIKNSKNYKKGYEWKDGNVVPKTSEDSKEQDVDKDENER